MNKKKIKLILKVGLTLLISLWILYSLFRDRNYFKLVLTNTNYLKPFLIVLAIQLFAYTIIPLFFRLRNKRPYPFKEAFRLSIWNWIIITGFIYLVRNFISLPAPLYRITIFIYLSFIIGILENIILIKKSKKDAPNTLVVSKSKLENKIDYFISNIRHENKKSSVTILSLLMFTMIGIFGIAVAFCIYIIISAPTFNPENLYNKEATIIYSNDGTEFAKIGMEKREIITYDELPEVLIDAIIATEDSRYFQHDGFDIARFTKAFLGQVSGNDSAGGGSTLTMQVAKNAYTDAKAVQGVKGIVRKATDIYLAIFKLEKVYTKEEIIEFYVNSPWLGNNSWGVEQACQTYFGKSVKDISLTEAAIIAGMFQAPASYNPFNSPELTAKRRSQVLNLMVRHGYITEQEATQAGSIPVESLVTTDKTSSKYQAVIDTIVEDILAKHDYDPYYDAYSTPMLIYSTFDLKKQDVINDLMNGTSFTFVNDVVQMSVAVTDVDTGGITAIGAGRNRVGERQQNYATQIKRQPGSTAKPFFDYGPLIEYNNASTYTPLFDENYTYSNGDKIVNADRKYLGLITMRYALARSRNIPALQAFQQLDPANVKEFVNNVGIDYGKNLYESYSIGGFTGMSSLQMSAAYATLARGGYYIEPYTYTKIVIRDTEEEIVYKPKRKKAMSEETAYMLTSMLETAVSTGALGGPISIKGTDVATKTGTTSIDESATSKYGIPSYAIMDSWFDLYSPDYSIAMWYGYDKLSSDYYLLSSAADKVRNRVAKILGTGILEPNSTFKKPAGVVEVAIEKETFPAQLASPYTPSDYITKELFKAGTEPVEVSERFNTLTNPTNAKAVYSNGTITISWDKITTPNAINTTYLQEHFNTYYKNWAEKYYNQRITYNTNYIGSVGYQLYLKNTTTGELTSLGYTTNNSYSYLTSNSNTTYTFVIKSAYSIFKANMSTGIEVEANPNNLSADVSFQLNDPTSVNKTSSLTYYTDTDSFKMIVNGIEVNNYTYIAKYYKINGTNETEISKIPLNEDGTYKISYIVTYNSKKYMPSKKIIVK